MATLSSHVLDSLQGTHAAGIRCRLFRVDDEGRTEVFDVRADHEGRILQEFAAATDGATTEFELVLQAAEYFAGQDLEVSGCVREVVLRFVAEDSGRYHLPVMLAPHSYSAWWSD